MLNLPNREIPVVKFKADLPDFLAGGKPCYLKVDARVAGPLNAAYSMGLDQLSLSHGIAAEVIASTEDPETRARKRHEKTKSLGSERIGLFYDACILTWESNILNGGKAITCDREHFLALGDSVIPEIAKAITDLELQCRKAGEHLLTETENTIKN